MDSQERPRLATALFCVALEPYLSLLSRWLFRGALTPAEDPAGEFPLAAMPALTYDSVGSAAGNSSSAAARLASSVSPPSSASAAVVEDGGALFFQRAFIFATVGNRNAAGRGGNGGSIKDAAAAAWEVNHLLPTFLQGGAG